MQRLRSRSVEVVPMDPPRHGELSATIRLFCDGFGLDLSSLITTFSPTASRIGQMLSRQVDSKHNRRVRMQGVGVQASTHRPSG